MQLVTLPAESSLVHTCKSNLTNKEYTQTLKDKQYIFSVLYLDFYLQE